MQYNTYNCESSVVFYRILIQKLPKGILSVQHFHSENWIHLFEAFFSFKNKLMYDRPAYSFQSVLRYTFRTKKAENSRLTDECSAGMCLNSQIDAVRPLHFYRAMGNWFQSTQNVVVVLESSSSRFPLIVKAYWFLTSVQKSNKQNWTVHQRRCK